MTDLPIFEIKDSLLSAMQGECPRVLLRAPTGSGKSTCVPPMLLDTPWGQRGQIIIVQPRRMAARLLARYVAKQCQSALGQLVGYAVRFERQMSAHTQIAFVTDGILERWLTDNPTLHGISTIIFDEFHERRLASDLSLGRVLQLQEQRTQENPLAILVMSATLETGGLQDYLDSPTCPCLLLEAQGRQFPVDISYHPASQVRTSTGVHQATSPLPIWEHATHAAKQAAQHPDCGDILIFMPGAYEIRRTAEILLYERTLRDRDIFELYSSLPPDKQNQAVETGSTPRIIIATNIAETSITIPGVRTVIDSGLVRQADWDPHRGMNTLHVIKTSQASAQQRAGRAGRVAPGRCIRLWSEAEHSRRHEFEKPEALRVDLAPCLLRLKSWSIKQSTSFPWLTEPDAVMLQRGLSQLDSLGATMPDGGLSPIGSEMISYPLEPRLARLLVSGQHHSCLPEMLAIASLIQGESLELNAGLHDDLHERTDYTDFQPEWRAALLAHTLRYEAKECSRYGILARGAREVIQSFKQLATLTGSTAKGISTTSPDFCGRRNSVITCLIESFADHVGVRTGIASNTCRIAGAQGVLTGKLASGSAALHAMHFVAASITELSTHTHKKHARTTAETRVQRCTQVELPQLLDCLPQHAIHAQVPVYDSTRKRVMLKERTIYQGLTLAEADKGDAPPHLAAPILAEKVIDGTLKLEQWDHAAEQWIYRVNALHTYMPELEFPTFGEQDKPVAITMLCEGAIGYKDIKDRAIMPVLNEWLSHTQRHTLEILAPTSLKLSNGLVCKLRFEQDGTPVIASTPQRLFGVKTTPHLFEGKLPIKFEILAPNQRPYQVTSSLESFWATGFPQMKKDLAGRYPRHKWE